MLRNESPHRLDRTGIFYTKSVVKSTDGEDVETWSVGSSLKFGILPPLRGKEDYQGHQAVSEQRYSLLIRKENRTITPDNYRVVSEGTTYHVDGVRPFREARNWLVLDCVVKDIQ